MSQPGINITQQDGGLGILPPSAGALYSVVGACSAGPLNTPQTFGRVAALVAACGDGPAVEAGAYYIERYGRPVVVTRTAQTTAGNAGAVNDDGVAGTSVVTADDVATEPLDDYEVLFLVVAGGTIGVAGITFRWSLDGGRTMSPLVALGAANTYTIPGSGVTVDFAAGTLIAGDTWSFVTTAPQWTAAELTTALTALRNSLVTWEVCHIVGAIDGTAFDAIDLAVAGMAAAGKYRAWIGNVRMPTPGETEAAYLASVGPALTAHRTIYGDLCAGACKLTSSVSGRKYRRPVSFPVAALEASVSQEIDTADVNLGSLPGVAITDANGNPDEHDESINPGLDDVGFTVLRTWDGIQGVYINRPRVFSAEGSDFHLFPHRRVFNLALAAVRLYLIRRVNRPVRVSKTTGFILESEALDIEAGARAVLSTALLAKPKASGATFVLSRTDNLLSTPAFNGEARIVPLAYPETFNLTVAYENPALQVVAV